MSDEITTPQEDMPQDRSAESEVSAESHSAYKVPVSDKPDIKFQLSGMFQNWFLDYASYVILERAVPHLADVHHRGILIYSVVFLQTGC